jgi:hypothetical protein
MNPEINLEVLDSPVRIRRRLNLQLGQSNQNERSRNLRLSLNHRVEQPIDLSSPTTPKDDQRKRKFPSSVITIAESSNPESCCSKKGKNVVQEVKEESCRGPTYRDNKGKGKLEARAYDGSFRDLSSDQPDLNSPPRRVGQRLLVRGDAPTDTARRNVVFDRGSAEGILNASKMGEEHKRGPAEGILNASKMGEEHKRGPAVRDNKGKGKFDGDARNDDIQVISPSQSGSSVPPRPVRQRWLVQNGVIAPRNIAERKTASNNGSTKNGANAPKRGELEAHQKLTVPQPSAVIQHKSGGQGSRPDVSSSVGGAGEDTVLSEIVADDPCRGVIRSRRFVSKPNFFRNNIICLYGNNFFFYCYLIIYAIFFCGFKKNLQAGPECISISNANEQEMSCAIVACISQDVNHTFLSK